MIIIRKLILNVAVESKECHIHLRNNIRVNPYHDEFLK